MAYLAKANVALSISLTTIATLLAPLITPALMQFFAGTIIPIDTWAMMISILKMVILPVVLGLIFNQLHKKRKSRLLAFLPQVSMIAIIVFIMIITANGEMHYSLLAFRSFGCNNTQCSRLFLRVLGL